MLMLLNLDVAKQHQIASLAMFLRSFNTIQESITEECRRRDHCSQHRYKNLAQKSHLMSWENTVVNSKFYLPTFVLVAPKNINDSAATGINLRNTFGKTVMTVGGPNPQRPQMTRKTITIMIRITMTTFSGNYNRWLTMDRTDYYVYRFRYRTYRQLYRFIPFLPRFYIPCVIVLYGITLGPLFNPRQYPFYLELCLLTYLRFLRILFPRHWFSEVHFLMPAASMIPRHEATSTMIISPSIRIRTYP